MILDTTTNPHTLHPDTGKRLYDKEMDYTTNVIYLPDFYTLEMCRDKYEEVDS